VNKSALARVLLESRSCWPHLIGIAGLSILSLPLTLLYPLPLKIVVDNVLGSQPLPGWLVKTIPVLHASGTSLDAAIAVLLGIALLVSAQSLAAWYLQTYTGEKLVWDFRAQLLNHVQRLPLMFHDRYGANDSV
jgi:ABC-type multidrug transport system fused ATPase/permease subunit